MKVIAIKIMNIKGDKGRLNCFVTCSIKNREPIANYFNLTMYMLLQKLRYFK